MIAISLPLSAPAHALTKQPQTTHSQTTYFRQYAWGVFLTAACLGSSHIAVASGFESSTRPQLATPNLLNKSQALRFQLDGRAQTPMHTWPRRSAETHANDSLQARLRATNTLGAAEPLIHDLREQGQFQLSVGRFTRHTHVQLNGQVDFQERSLFDDDDVSLTLDGSSMGFYLGNWDISVGAVDRWWGPAWQSPLLMSNNARPIPALSFDRVESKAFETPLLRWIGPWQVSTFLGQLESDRTIANALIWGFRLTTMPIQGFEIGVSRTALFGGNGRSAGPRDLYNVVLGRDNEADQPGNQLGSFDFSYRFSNTTLGNTQTGQEIYLEVAGEDEAGAFPAKKFSTLGFTGFIYHQNTNKAWHYLIEYSNTTAGSFDGENLPSITYEHHIYQTGYTHRGQVIGSPLNGDTESITLGLWLDQSLKSSWQQLQSPSHLGAWLSKKNFSDGELHQVSFWHEKRCWTLQCKTTITGFDQPMKNQVIDPDGDYFALSFGVSWAL